MSSVFKVVAAVANVAAMIPGPHAPIAAAVAAVATIGAVLTQKKPSAPGSVSNITIGADQLSPYMMGETYARLAMVHDVGYGGTVSDVVNPYRTWVFIASAGGPIESIDAIQGDFEDLAFDAGSAGMPGGEAIGYYENFLWADSQLGACPEAAALTDGGTIPGFGASAKLSGKAAILVTAKHDKKGKRWASGVPQWGVRGKGVLVYDPRQDDTYPGGSGACRALEEDTYVGGAAALNPGCHAVTYALGRWQGAGTPKKVFGIGRSPLSIDWTSWVEFMNTCDANGWEIGGNVFEPGSRWDNLKRICQAGGGKPCRRGGLLSVRFPRPRVALDTITMADLAGAVRIPGMKRWRERLNTIVPKYRSADHKWEHVPAEAVVSATHLSEDGEEKKEERLYELVQDVDQASQLAAYDIFDSREIGPIVAVCKPRLMEYRVGDALELDLPEEGIEALLCTVLSSSVDPATSTVTLTLETETTGKHASALGLAGTAPTSPTLSTGEEMDDAAFGVVPSAPDPADWDAEGASLASPGGAIPAILVTGAAPDTDGLLGIQFDYRIAPGAIALEGSAAGWLLWDGGTGDRILLEGDVPGPWISAMLDAPEVTEKQIVSVTPGTQYEVSIQYVNRAGVSDRLIIGPVEVGVLLPAESVAVEGGFDRSELEDMRNRIAALE